MGGIEPNPGPPKAKSQVNVTAQPNAGAWATSPDGLKAQQETLDKLIALSQDSVVQNVLRKYKPAKKLKAIINDLNTEKKDNLVMTMTFLGVANQADVIKPTVIDNLISRVQNLLPDMCSHCDTPYCIELQETPLISCCMCGQGAHTPCFASLINIEQKDIATTTSDEVMKLVNPLNISTMHYLCEACSADVIPQPASSKAAPGDPTSQSTPPQSVTNDDVAAGPDAGSSDAAETIDIEIPDPMATQNTQQPQRRHRKSGESNKRPHGTVKHEDVCPHFIKGTCRHGPAGTDCPKTHPRICWKFLSHGERPGRGCSYGTKCKFYHPPICQASLKKSECLDDTCRKRHLGGTRRTNSRPICPSSQQKLECFESECKLHHLKGTKRTTPRGVTNPVTKKPDFLDMAQLVSTLKDEMMSAMMGAIDTKFSSMQTAPSHAPTSVATSQPNPAQNWSQLFSQQRQPQAQQPAGPATTTTSQNSTNNVLLTQLISQLSQAAR